MLVASVLYVDDEAAIQAVCSGCATAIRCTLVGSLADAQVIVASPSTALVDLWLAKRTAGRAELDRRKSAWARPTSST